MADVMDFAVPLNPEDQQNQQAGAETAPPAPPPPKEMGVTNYVTDMFMGGLSGIGDAVNETTDLFHSGLNYVDNHLLGDSLIPEKNPILLPSYDPQTTAGGVTKGLSQFLTAFVGAGKLLAPFKAAAALKTAGKAGEVAHGLLQGAVADFIGFDPKEGRFANVLQDAGIQNDVVNYLAADPNDSKLEGRFKNALEGAGLGLAMEPVFMAFKGLKKVYEGAKSEGVHGAVREMVDNHGAVEEAMAGGLEPKPNAVTGRQLTPPASPKYVDPEEMKKLIERPDDAFSREDLSKAVNYDMYQGSEKALAEMDHIAEATAAGWDDGVRSLDTVKAQSDALADMAGESDEFANALRVRAAQDAKSVSHMDARLRTYKIMYIGLTDDIDRIGQSIIQTGGSPEDKAKFLQRIAQAEDLFISLKNVQKEAARTVRFSAIPNQPVSEMTMEQLQEAVSRAGGDKKVMDIALRLRGAEGNPKAMSKILKEMNTSSFWDVHHEYWVNAVLSNPKTSAVNMLSNQLMAVMMPAERMLGGAITGDMASVREGMRLYAGMYRYAWDALKEACVAFKYDRNMIDSGGSVFDKPVGSITSQGLQLRSDSTLGMATDYIGSLVRLPSRFLGAQDEFFKQLNYRAKVYSDAMAAAMDDASLRGDPKAIAKFVEDKFAEAIDKGVGNYKPALDYAREATFTSDLEYGISRDLQTMAAKNPMVRAVLPFVRTPANIIRQAWQRTPILGSYQRQLAKDLASSDPIIKSAAYGKVATGSLLWTTAIMAAGNGAITGGGPKDANLKSIMMDQAGDGWQPYSIVTANADGTKTYTRYDRLDPIGMFFGLAADFHAASQLIEDGKVDEVAAAMITAIAKNVTSKTYLRGITDALDALMDPEKKAQKFIMNRASTYVPFSALLGQVRRDTDPHMRELRSVMDAVVNRVPGMSDSLPAKRSWITGNPVVYPEGIGHEYIPDLINPFTKSTGPADPVLAELVRLKHGFVPPSKTLIEGQLDLTPQQYERYNELHGTVKIGGKTMMDRLRDVIGSPGYDAERKNMPDIPDGTIDPRTKMVQRVITQYRETAKNALINEDATLKQAYTSGKQQRFMAMRGQMRQLGSLLDQ